MAPTLIPGGEVEAHFSHEFLHSRTAVVTRDVVVQVFPDSLDAIVVGTVRWQEVELNLARRGQLQCQSDLLAVVDAVAVENEVNPTSAPVRLCYELVQEIQEQAAVFPVRFDPPRRPPTAR